MTKTLQEIFKDGRMGLGNIDSGLDTDDEMAVAFETAIRRMNQMYELPIKDIPEPEDDTGDRLQKLWSILKEEVDEINDILPVTERDIRSYGPITELEVDYLTELADVLGDIVVYCFSEALRNGIPLQLVLAIIMQSNFSKLGEDGKPIKDERGKFQKGPNYWKPEPMIKELLKGLREQNCERDE